jgi:hypothetical protein
MTILLRMLSALLLVAVAVAAPAQTPTPAPAEAAKVPTVRPEIGKPVQAAIELLKAKKGKDALAKIKEAEPVKDKTPYEAFIIDSVRGQAQALSGEPAAAAASLDSAANSPAAPANMKTQLIAGAAEQFYIAKDYAKSADRLKRYFQEGGKEPALRTLYVQSLYLAGDYPQATKELQADLQADIQAGKTPPEDRLQMLANIALKQQDSAGYANALEQLVAYHPKRDYWLAAIDATARRAHFPDRLTLDLMRLKLATGTLRSTGEYMEMAQLSLQAGFPAEAKQVVDQGYAAGLLGTGADAARHQRLKALAAKTLADDDRTLGQDESQAQISKDGTALVNTGFNYVLHGQSAKGLAMMEQGLKRGGLKHPEDARLHYAYALYLAHENARAAQSFKALQGSDADAALARLWVLHLGSKS